LVWAVLVWNTDGAVAEGEVRSMLEVREYTVVGEEEVVFKLDAWEKAMVDSRYDGCGVNWDNRKRWVVSTKEKIGIKNLTC
jgi:hypothetical protein